MYLVSSEMFSYFLSLSQFYYRQLDLISLALTSLISNRRNYNKKVTNFVMFNEMCAFKIRDERDLFAASNLFKTTGHLTSCVVLKKISKAKQLNTPFSSCFYLSKSSKSVTLFYVSPMAGICMHIPPCVTSISILR